MKDKGLVSVIELRRLLVELKEKRPDICFRYRLLGELWSQQFMRVMLVTEKGVILNEENSNKLGSISDLSNIMQFELDNRFQDFEPYYHYEVRPLPEI